MPITMFLLKVEWGLAGLRDLINVHPLFVHSPIGLWLGAFAFYFLGTLFKKDALLAAGKWVLYLGTLTAVVTAGTGLQAERTVPHGYEVHELILFHKYVALSAFVLALLLSGWIFFLKASIPSKGKAVFLTGLALLIILVTQAGDLGGRMVFLHGVGVGRKSMMQEAAPHAHEHHEHGGQEHAGHEHR